MKRRSYFSRILSPPDGTPVLRAPRSPFAGPPDAAASAARSLPPGPVLGRAAAPVTADAPSVRSSFAEQTATGERSTTGPPRPALETARTMPPEPAGSRKAGAEQAAAPSEAASAPVEPAERTAASLHEPNHREPNRRESRETNVAAENRTSASSLEQPGLPRSPLTETPAPAFSAVRPDNPRPPATVQPSPAPTHRVWEAQPQPRTTPLGPPSPPDRETAARVEIGSIEVRLIQPAPAPRRAARPRATGPMARTSTLPFGLRQI